MSHPWKGGTVVTVQMGSPETPELETLPLPPAHSPSASRSPPHIPSPASVLSPCSPRPADQLLLLRSLPGSGGCFLMWVCTADSCSPKASPVLSAEPGCRMRTGAASECLRTHAGHFSQENGLSLWPLSIKICGTNVSSGFILELRKKNH